MTLPARLQEVVRRAAAQNRPVAEGRVAALHGIAVEVSGLRAALGDVCTIRVREHGVPAEVVGFRGERAILMPLGDAGGLAPLAPVLHHGKPLAVTVGPALLGRVLDALGEPVDGGPPLRGEERPITGEPPGALQRARITQAFASGISAIDGFLTCGKGQRIGIFAGSGVGKSTLLGMIARGSSAQVNVIALVGERGREVREFLEDSLGAEGMARSVVVVATSDVSPMLRMKAPAVAASIAEWFRDQGHDVLFLMDSVTRFAGAAREIGLAAGEPPTLRGYPPSLFAHLPRLVERLGNSEKGSITGLLTVLVDGDDLNEPVSDALRGYLDGHIVLSRKIAARGRFPSIDVLGSVSRLMDKVTSAEHVQKARAVRELLAHYEENRDLVQVGAYRKGADALLDKALARIQQIEGLLYQGREQRPMQATLERLYQAAI
ncbi:MAG: FliI/YscN family ATPase [Planctomycetes bacterium]|nr:FliI/YscN family ATPase [Planctomycetota bacterium]